MFQEQYVFCDVLYNPDNKLKQVLKTQGQIFKEHLVQEYCSCDKAYQFLVLKGIFHRIYLKKPRKINKQKSSTFYTSNKVCLQAVMFNKLTFNHLKKCLVHTIASVTE